MQAEYSFPSGPVAVWAKQPWQSPSRPASWHSPLLKTAVWRGSRRARAKKDRSSGALQPKPKSSMSGHAYIENFLVASFMAFTQSPVSLSYAQAFIGVPYIIALWLVQRPQSPEVTVEHAPLL